MRPKHKGKSKQSREYQTIKRTTRLSSSCQQTKNEYWSGYTVKVQECQKSILHSCIPIKYSIVTLKKPQAIMLALLVFSFCAASCMENKYGIDC